MKKPIIAKVSKTIAEQITSDSNLQQESALGSQLSSDLDQSSQAEVLPDYSELEELTVDTVNNFVLVLVYTRARFLAHYYLEKLALVVHCPWELLYADNLVIAIESLEEHKQTLLRWKYEVETKGL